VLNKKYKISHEMLQLLILFDFIMNTLIYSEKENHNYNDADYNEANCNNSINKINKYFSSKSFILSTDSDIPDGAGLGSSSAYNNCLAVILLVITI